jgi:hypothetical protein
MSTSAWENSLITAVVNEVAKVIAELKGQFLAIFRLLDREILIHWVCWQMLEIVEKKIARDDPAYLKIISELNR